MVPPPTWKSALDIKQFLLCQSTFISCSVKVQVQYVILFLQTPCQTQKVNWKTTLKWWMKMRKRALLFLHHHHPHPQFSHFHQTKPLSGGQLCHPQLANRYVIVLNGKCFD